jgi:hypothetical protein
MLTMTAIFAATQPLRLTLAWTPTNSIPILVLLLMLSDLNHPLYLLSVLGMLFIGVAG